MKRLLLLCMMLIVGLAACGGDDDSAESDTDTTDNGQLGALEWERDADTIILRLDQRLNAGPPAQIANEIPNCTLWGDGRLVWVNALGTQQEVLEGRLNDDEIRSLIELVVFSGFYDWQSNYVIPEINNPVISSITLNLFAEDRTVSRFEDWPADGFNRILEACQSAEETPALYLPNGAWISAYEVQNDGQAGSWRWLPDTAGFSLADVVDGQPPQWIEGDFAQYVWDNSITSLVTSYVLDADRAYELVVQVPGISRDAPPAPADS